MARDASLDDFAAGSDDDADDAASEDASGDDATEEDVAAAASDAAASAASDAAVSEGSEDAVEAAEAREGVAIREPSAVEPAVATSTVTSAGAACASCGASARRLWTADGDVVCADCKPW